MGIPFKPSPNVLAYAQININKDGRAHGTGAGRRTGKSRFFDQVRGNAAVHDAEHVTHDRGTAGKQESQRVWKAQHPLAHRLCGKHLIHQQRRTLGNCSCIALPPASMQSSAMRRAPQLGQKPRRLQLNAKSCSA